MPLPLFRTKSSEGKRRSRDLVDKETFLSLTNLRAAVEEESCQSPLRGSYESALLQSSQDMEDVMRRLQAVIGIDGDGSNRTAPRASNAALSKLPHARIMRHNKKEFEHDESACGVCCDRLIDGAALVRLPCGHVYHINCATTWLSKTCTCPECRYEIETDDYVYEKTRATRMQERETMSCSCHPSGMHSCFFVDSSKSLISQLDSSSTAAGCVVIDDSGSLAGHLETCLEITNESKHSNYIDSSEFSLSDSGSCDFADPNELDRYFR
jgi:hypothetical protein